MKIALCQLAVTGNKTDNINRARVMLKQAASSGAAIAILPEMFCINYSLKDFESASETVPNGEACEMLREAAKQNSMTVIGGTIPEKSNSKLYNTCVVFSHTGEFMGKYQKAHLFDIDLDGFKFMESDVISAGNKRPLIIDEPIKTGIAVCFDIRFPEWSRIIMDAGADLIALPAAFSPKTGPAHWELLLRARAVDNQCFVAGVAPAASSSSYGHSMLVSPNGTVLCDLGCEENVVVIDIPMEELTRIRNSIPIHTARRKDLY